MRGKVIVLLCVLTGCSPFLGCSPSWPSMGRMTFVSTDEHAAPVEILRKDVRGRWCVERGFLDTMFPARVNKLFVDYSLAVEVALRQVPDATVLVNVTVEEELRQSPFGSEKCARVRGDAARVP